MHRMEETGAIKLNQENGGGIMKGGRVAGRERSLSLRAARLGCSQERDLRSGTRWRGGSSVSGGGSGVLKND